MTKYKATVYLQRALQIMLQDRECFTDDEIEALQEVLEDLDMPQEDYEEIMSDEN